MCESELEAKYKALVQGKTILESCLHQNLSEHLNSEIGLGTITDVDSAKKWIKESFMYQRIQKNSAHYALDKNDNQSWKERIDELVIETVDKLQQSELVECVEGSEDGKLGSTEYGDIMSKVRTGYPGFLLCWLKTVLYQTNNGMWLTSIRK